MAKKEVQHKENELVAGKTYTVTEKTREAATAKLRALRQEAFSQGLCHQEGGFIQYSRDYKGKDKFFAAVRFNP